jgi:hypothetical protein
VKHLNMTNSIRDCFLMYICIYEHTKRLVHADQKMSINYFFSLVAKLPVVL